MDCNNFVELYFLRSSDVKKADSVEILTGLDCSIVKNKMKYKRVFMLYLQIK